jgi:hypothetical protein
MGLTETRFLESRLTESAKPRTAALEPRFGIRPSTNRFYDHVNPTQDARTARRRSDSLPVVTISDQDRVLQDRLYAEKVAVKLLEYLIRIDEVRGAGRLYVP